MSLDFLDQAPAGEDGRPIAKPGGSGGGALHARLNELYHGQTAAAVAFRFAWLAVDLLIIAFFIVAPIIRDTPEFLILDYLVAAVVTIDLTARGIALGDWRAFIRRPSTWIDLFVLVTLLFPQWLFNLGFLRILKLWTLVNSGVFWTSVARRYDNTRAKDVTRSLVTLLTFVFIVTGFVYTGFVGTENGVDGYFDALYFTISSLTTTGYGDITLPGTRGKLLSIVIMVVGITLFVRLAQALFRPHKVRYRCLACGLGLHDPDAVHCKACGALICIPNDEA